jgi:uncharacterized cupredoxin-like copper-binding protein
MLNKRGYRRRLPFSSMMAFILGAIAMSSAAMAQPQKLTARLASNETKTLEVTIVSTEFQYVPAKVRVPAGHPITLVLDNSEGETEHRLFLPAFNFRLEAKAGEIARKTTVFAKAGEYEFNCDLPGHREAGMKGTMIVENSLVGR